MHVRMESRLVVSVGEGFGKIKMLDFGHW
jgi:hypothetical protein